MSGPELLLGFLRERKAGQMDQCRTDQWEQFQRALGDGVVSGHLALGWQVKNSISPGTAPGSCTVAPTLTHSRRGSARTCVGAAGFSQCTREGQTR